MMLHDNYNVCNDLIKFFRHEQHALVKGVGVTIQLRTRFFGVERVDPE